jgi:hypothetical protein
MGKNNRRGATNKDALEKTQRQQKGALFANCSALMDKAKGAEDHAAKQQECVTVCYRLLI